MSLLKGPDEVFYKISKENIKYFVQIFALDVMSP